MRFSVGGLMQVEITDGDILVDAVLLGELLDIEPAGSQS
jgi:hypothetical protein